MKIARTFLKSSIVDPDINTLAVKLVDLLLLLFVTDMAMVCH